ncbi:MAG: hypothetical protein R3C15_03165 [Thermoleophilia bacterium]
MLHAPQLITNARMLYLVWRPADPAASAALLPDGLAPAEPPAVYLNQYVVDDPLQTSNGADPDGFGAYSLTYLGVDLGGLVTEAGVPGRFWTHYWNSSPSMIRYALDHGVPATAGETRLDLDGDTLVARSIVDGAEVIRTTARARVGSPTRATGQLRYVTQVGGDLVSGRYPFVADLAEHFEVVSLEFLGDAGGVSALRPADPLEVTFGFYSEAITFCYPGGEGPLGSAHGS